MDEEKALKSDQPDSMSSNSDSGTASTLEESNKSKGHDNPAFEDEKKSNASSSSSSNEDASGTTVNLELVDLTPPKSKKEIKAVAEDDVDANVDVEKGNKGKKRQENLDYFVPVNEHKKGLR